MPKVAIIILNWNGLADTLACLASLQHLTYPVYEIILVDNNSSDNSVAVLKSTYPNIHLIKNSDNLGFVGGNNIGLQYAKTINATYALLLNNDTEVTPNFLNLLVNTAQTDPQIGITGPTIYYFNQPQTIWSAGGEINWHTGLTQMIGIGQEDIGQFGNTPRHVDFVTGCALLIKISVVDKIGMLDERFFAYYEETEWCVRVSRAGYKILHVPQAKIWHKISPVAREASPQVHYYMTRNRLLFLKLTHAGIKPRLNTLFNYARTLLSWTIKPKWQHKAPQKHAMQQAILDYFRGRFGRVDITP